MRFSVVASVATTAFALPAHVERAEASTDPLSAVTDITSKLPIVGDLLPSKRAEDTANPLSAVTDITSNLPIVGDLLPSKRAEDTANPLSAVTDITSNLPIVGDLLPSKRAEDTANPLSAVTDITSNLPIVGDLLPSKRADPLGDLISKVFNQTETTKRQELPGLDIVSQVINKTVGALPSKRQDEISTLIGDIVDQVKNAADGAAPAPSKRAESDPLAPVTDIVKEVLGGATGSTAKRADSDPLKPVEDLISGLLGGAAGSAPTASAKRALDASTLQQLAGQVENALNLTDDQKNAINGALSQFTTSLSKRAEISIEDLAKEAVQFIMNGDQAGASSKRDAQDIVGSVISKVEGAISGDSSTA